MYSIQAVTVSSSSSSPSITATQLPSSSSLQLSPHLTDNGGTHNHTCLSHTHTFISFHNITSLYNTLLSQPASVTNPTCW